MRLHHQDKRLLAAAALLALACPGQASAGHTAAGFDAVATISACRGESLTIAAEISPASDRAAARRALRAVRGASLRLRLAAAPLYGGEIRGLEIDLGRTTTARRFERFDGLPAQTYHGVVRYRWVRAGRTVASGFLRTRKGRAAGRRGRAACSLSVGLPPVDTTPPFVAPLPSDGGWHRAPLGVYMYALDDLSGVALVVTRLDGGPFVRGRTLQISAEGVHRLEYFARDAAGNQSRGAAVTLRVDANPPSAPVVTAPSGDTSDSTPEVRWDPSSDSASGVAGYFALVRDANGAMVWSQATTTTTAVTVDPPLAPGQYTAEVYAFDYASPVPFFSAGASAFAVVAAG
jgi:hypothetical protein